MRITLALITAALLLAGCDSTQRTTSTRNSTDKTGSTTTTTTTKTSTTPPTTVNRPSYDGTGATSAAGDGDTKPAAAAPQTGGTSKLAPASTDKTGTAGPSTAEPDNTAVNERDRDGSAKTPIDQNENQRDVNITAEIRKAVLAHKDMSINGRNVKIITADGKVTLRGPVNSEDEKKVIEGIAQNLAGKDNVTSEIDVKAQK